MYGNVCTACIIVDGQRIAKKLSSQIAKETKIIRGLLDEYCVCQAGDTSHVLSLQDALDPHLVGSRLQQMGIFCSTIASGQKREVIDCYLSLCRSKEEIVMLKQEAEYLVLYYKKMQQTLELEIQ